MNVPDMCHKPEPANKTVQQGCFAITYDEDGYAKRAVKTSDSPGYEVDGKTYDGNGDPLPKEG